MQVATQIDPASARLGESLYTFVPRSVVGNLRDGVMMELERLRVRNIPFLSLQNKCAPGFSSLGSPRSAGALVKPGCMRAGVLTGGQILAPPLQAR